MIQNVGNLELFGGKIRGIREQNFTSSGSKLLVHSTLKNRSEAKIPSFSMMKTPAEPSFYYLSIDHYSLAIALLIQQ